MKELPADPHATDVIAEYRETLKFNVPKRIDLATVRWLIRYGVLEVYHDNDTVEEFPSDESRTIFYKHPESVTVDGVPAPTLEWSDMTILE